MNGQKVRYYLDDKKRFVVENYNWAKPFFIDKSKSLKLKLKPILPHWLFTGEQEKCRIYTGEGKPVDITVPANCFAFKFLGRIIVIYRNDKRRSTFGKNAAKIASYTLQYADGKTHESKGDTLDTPLAIDVREGRVERMDVVFG